MSKETEHKEWKKENTLTTPSDRDLNTKFRLEQNAPPLTEEQVTLALKTLNNTSFTEKFPEVERRFVDPPIDLQRIGLISFVPAKGAKPNEQGVYGFAKLRGNFASEVEASEQAEKLIRNVDSYHQIYHTFVGRPFPLTISSDYSKEVSKVDLRKETTKAIEEDVKRKREKEQKEIEEIKEREKNLLEDVKKTDENKDDYYTTLRVKKAQLTWTYAETEKKMKQMCGLIAKARHEIEELDKVYPELKNTYYQKYMDARRQAGFTSDKTDHDQSFMKYLVEDLKLPSIEAEYQRLFGQEPDTSNISKE
jgi:hypothetical protein